MSSIAPQTGPASGDWQQQLHPNNQRHQPHIKYTAQKPNAHVTSCPVNEHLSEQPLESVSLDRQQSFASSNESNNLPLPDLGSPTFSFDNYLTPDYSSEDQINHTTPEIEDLKWQENFKESEQTDFEHTHGSSMMEEPGLNGVKNAHVSDSQHPFHHHLPSPQLTNTPTPADLTSHSRQQSTASSMLANPMYASHRPKRSLASLQVEGFVDQYSPEREGRLGSIEQDYQVISPVILVSTHVRGDSPASSHRGLQRSLSRRSNASQSSTRLQSATNLHRNLEETQDLGNNTDSQLLHPFDSDRDGWQEDETERAGVAPTARNDVYVPSLNDMEKRDKLDETITGIQHWLANTKLVDKFPDDAAAQAEVRDRLRRNKIRSRSTGARSDAMGLPVFNDSYLPGPGVLIDEKSTYYYSDDESGTSDTIPEEPASPPAQVHLLEDDARAVDTSPIDVVAPEEFLPSARQFLRRPPFADAINVSDLPDAIKCQPQTANMAMMQFGRQAQNFDTASRSATWGTRRRSESEAGSIMENKTRHLSLTKNTPERHSSFKSSLAEVRSRARDLIPRRSNSNVKKGISKTHTQQTDELQVVVSPEPANPSNSTESNKPVSPRPSWTRQRTPSINTSGAFLAMTGHLTAVGASASGVNLEPEPKSPLRRALKRMRSKSEIPKSPKPVEPVVGLSEMIARQGGMPGTNMRSPPPQEPLAMTAVYPGNAIVDDDDGDDDDAPMIGNGVKMELSVRAGNIIPSFEGFKTHARELNPRLEPYLIDRIGHDQVRRYKRLVKSKVDHKRAVDIDENCESGQLCSALQGDADVTPALSSFHDHHSQAARSGDSDIDESNFDGVVTANQFPEGIPMPPATHLPAEFECPLCFQVKSFRKPSDWTKHVHEDVQPFTCTFPLCSEPRPFKRKADWVRHENERHRHLESWKCNIPECNHICFRKDNFVQHLVREHKRKEPQNKGRGVSTTKIKGREKSAVVAADRITSEDREFWQLVEACRVESTKAPMDEPCKFCGNKCNSWKKLSVHVGKHMEQIALPVLHLAKIRTVTTDTVLSPVESHVSQLPMPPAPKPTMILDRGGLSPHAINANSAQQMLATGQAPPHMQAHPHHNPGMQYHQSFLEAGVMRNREPTASMNGGLYGGASSQYAPNLTYMQYAGAPVPGYNHTATYPPIQMQGPMRQNHQQQQPVSSRSPAMEARFHHGQIESVPVPVTFYQQQPYYTSPELEQAGFTQYGASPVMGPRVKQREDLGPSHAGSGSTPTMQAHHAMGTGYGYTHGTAGQGYF